MSRVLVTGSGGYIGRHVVEALLNLGHEVIAVDIRNDGLDPRAIALNCSIFDDNPNVFYTLKEPDVCIHLAWRNGFIHNAPSHMEDLSAHCRFLRYMIEGGLKNLAVIGTMHEVGYWEGEISDDTPCNPLSQYGVAKNALRQALMQQAKEKGFNLYWLRGFYILGDDMKNHSIFTKILQKAQEGAVSFPFNSGKNLYDFISVDQLAERIALAATQEEITGIINICTGHPVSLAEKVEEFIKEKGLSIKLDYGAFPDRPYDSPGIWGNPDKINMIIANSKKKKTMKFFVTGVGGQLGHDVMNELAKRGYEGIGSDIQPVYSGVADGSAVTTMPYVQLDITDKDAVEKVIMDVKPDAVIHCAAWTAVDMAEDDDKVEKVRAINAGGTQNIANVCKKLDCKMTYISTDYVFDGQGTEPWQPDCKDYKPLSIYGQTKLEGELAVSSTLDKYFIVRTAWVFGKNGKNFIKTMLKLAQSHDCIRVVKDQVGTPTYTYDFARLLVDMNETEKYGYYHATNEGGYISWYDFTCEIFKQAGYTTKVVPVTTEEYGLSKAARPFNSRLDKSKLVENGFQPLPTWQDALSRYLKEIN